MGVTIRVVRGRKARDSKYTIRRSVKVHAYGTSNGFAVRVNESKYMGRTSSNNLATITADSSEGERRKYVSIR